MASQLRDTATLLLERWDVLEGALRKIEPSLKAHMLKLVQENRVLEARISEQASTIQNLQVEQASTIQKLQVEKSRQAESLQHLRGEQSRLSDAFEGLKSENSRLSVSIQQLTSEKSQLSGTIVDLSRRLHGFNAIRGELFAQEAALRGMGR
jgi:predicted nuclease with TOPRIM domain